MTVAEWLQNLSQTDTSSERDSKMMQALIRRGSDFPKAVVTCGIVYLGGAGSVKYPPLDIHTMAKILLKKKQPA